MKKLLFIFCALALTVVSCETSELETNEELLKVDQSKIESLKTMSPDNRITAFNLLNNNERVKLWNDRIDVILKTKKLNSVQKQSIEDLKKLIKPQLFDSSNDLFNEDLKGWAMDNEDKFNKEDFVLYFASLNDLDNQFQRGVLTHEGDPGGGASGGTPDCNCNRTNDFCYMSSGGQFCNFANCSGRPFGCGIIAAQSCNGVCGSH